MDTVMKHLYLTNVFFAILRLVGFDVYLLQVQVSYYKANSATDITQTKNYFSVYVFIVVYSFLPPWLNSP